MTLSVTVNAAGDVGGMRVVHDGERVMAGPNKKYCNSLPENTVLGKVKFSVTDSGYVKRATFLQICMDLYEYCIENRIPFPVILFIDGYGGHYGLEIAEYCREHQIILLGELQ